jgi:hypothetical protein
MSLPPTLGLVLIDLGSGGGEVKKNLNAIGGLESGTS